MPTCTGKRKENTGILDGLRGCGYPKKRGRTVLPRLWLEQKGLLCLRAFLGLHHLFILISGDWFFRPDDARGPGELQNIEDALALSGGRPLALHARHVSSLVSCRDR